MKRLATGGLCALAVALPLAVMADGPWEALCEFYGPNHPMWYILGCWQLPG